jgi:hypothetical protein
MKETTLTRESAQRLIEQVLYVGEEDMGILKHVLETIRKRQLEMLSTIIEKEYEKMLRVYFTSNIELLDAAIAKIEYYMKIGDWSNNNISNV